MTSRSPCEAYLKYLVVHPDKYDNERVRSIVKYQELDFMGEPYLDHLRLACVPPNPFFPEDERHRPSQRFLLREQIHTIFHPDEHMKCAWTLLGRPRAKEIIEHMTITQATPAWICSALRRCGYEATPTSIERYQHYFFNLSDINRRDLEATLVKRGVSDKSTDPDEQAFNNALVAANKRDVRVLSAQAAVPALAGMMNQIRMGIMPSNMEVSRIVKATQVVASARALETALDYRASQSRDFGFVSKMMTEILESVGDLEEDLQEGLRGMTLRTEDREVPTVKELTDGSHTLDVQPIIDEEVEANVERR